MNDRLVVCDSHSTVDGWEVVWNEIAVGTGALVSSLTASLYAPLATTKSYVSSRDGVYVAAGTELLTEVYFCAKQSDTFGLVAELGYAVPKMFTNDAGSALLLMTEGGAPFRMTRTGGAWSITQLSGVAPGLVTALSENLSVAAGRYYDAATESIAPGLFDLTLPNTEPVEGGVPAPTQFLDRGAQWLISAAGDFYYFTYPLGSAAHTIAMPGDYLSVTHNLVVTRLGGVTQATKITGIPSVVTAAAMNAVTDATATAGYLTTPWPTHSEKLIAVFAHPTQGRVIWLDGLGDTSIALAEPHSLFTDLWCIEQIEQIVLPTFFTQYDGTYEIP